ncbi:MAG: transposase, partial [Ilumatobacteraceae bacterium]
MGRALRQHRQVGWFHVMNRGAGRRDIFTSDADRVGFGAALGEACERHDIEVHAYCLMPNHFHLVVHCPDGNLSTMMQWLQAVVTRRFNRRHGNDGPILRGRFRSKEIDTDAYLVAATHYVHLNPAVLSGRRAVESYRWSSLRTYLGHRAAPSWLRTDVVLGLHGDDRAAFVAAMVRPLGELDPVLLEILAEFAVEEFADELVPAPRLARTVLLAVADELGTTAPALLEHLASGRSDTVQRALRRARGRVVAEPGLRFPRKVFLLAG